MFTVFSTVLWWSEVEVEWGVDTRISLNKPVLIPDRVDLADFGGGVGGSSSLVLPSPARHGDVAKKGAGDSLSSSASLRQFKRWTGVVHGSGSVGVSALELWWWLKAGTSAVLHCRWRWGALKAGTEERGEFPRLMCYKGLDPVVGGGWILRSEKQKLELSRCLGLVLSDGCFGGDGDGSRRLVWWSSKMIHRALIFLVFSGFSLLLLLVGALVVHLQMLYACCNRCMFI